MAWAAEEAAKCHGCGLPLDETTDPEYPYVYVAHKVECIACEERGIFERKLDKEEGGRRPGVYTRLEEEPAGF